MGDKQKVNIRLKTTPQAKEMTFFEIFFSVAHLHVETKLFSFKKIHIFNSSEISWGGTRKSVTSTNERTNDERTNDDELHGRS